MRYISMLLLFTAISFTGFAQNKDAILGQWINSTGEAHVEIFKKGVKYYGKIVWLKTEKDEKGIVKTDLKNPDARLRSKPILGMEILKDFVYDDGKWTEGKIYDPKSGKTYSCNMNIKDNEELNMRGYVGISLIGRSEVWKRVK
ncbi:hypothetical protein SAMN06265348_107196 [Pedobacter westerhofensis]|uniref:DUF2147 domain-containing protein n=1 Tax=Pedobacter westerhofensis TaxID=425512 RepID=A0A521E7T5_9SPHI|nr:DUF2147 domain-containing protein [Pedobacter westerhofensis]SMO79998.1 hypothetical protein SAMN06265348_107196 [Pedobacter westerhofensis]